MAKAAVLLTRVSPTGRRKYRGYIPDPGDTDQGLRIRVFFVGQIRILKRLNPISYSKKVESESINQSKIGFFFQYSFDQSYDIVLIS